MAAHPDPYDLLKSFVSLSESSFSLEDKLDRMLRTLTEAFESDRCLFLRPDKIEDRGFLAGLASGKKPFWVDETSPFQEEKVLSEEEDLICPSFACIPLYGEASCQGILYMGFSKSRRFSAQETDLILLIAKEMEWAILKDHLYRKVEQVQEYEKRVKRLSTLWELNKALLTTVNFEHMIHMTLTAITIGDGFGFNRAMLFLVDEKDHILKGTMAVGPDNAEEAGKIWPSLSQKKEPLLDSITRLPSHHHSLINSVVKELRIPLEQEQCILSRTVLEGRPFNIQFPQSEEGWIQSRCERGCHLGSEVGCYVSEHLSRDFRAYSYATIPLWGKGRVIGVILVDNLYNQNPITGEDIHFLSMFSNQAGLAIENVLLYRNLEEIHQELKETQNLLVHREKMAALGELCNSVAHEIKNPLVAIGGFARRLDRATPQGYQEKRYTETIIKEVTRLEKILDDIHTYTRHEASTFQEWDLREIFEESLSIASEGVHGGGIRIVREFAERLPRVKGDYHQLKQAFSHLIRNAYQAMNGNGTLFIRIHPVSKNGSSFIRAEVQDTGNGIDPENLHNIFNPFYSTKEGRLGLGLPTIHKIIISHQGRIEVDNHPGEGVNFIITLPVVQEKNE
jgi:two-component system sensor histidine kinase HydH